MSQRVWIPREAIERAITVGLIHIPDEGGGIILGYATEGDIVVEELGMPGPKSQHSAYRYRHDYDHDVELIDKAYNESKGVVKYIGDWHTHPGTKTPYLSGADRRMVGRSLKNKEGRLTCHVTLIFALTDEEVRLGAWIADRSRRLGFFPRMKVEPLTISLY